MTFHDSKEQNQIKFSKRPATLKGGLKQNMVFILETISLKENNIKKNN